VDVSSFDVRPIRDQEFHDIGTIIAHGEVKRGLLIPISGIDVGSGPDQLLDKCDVAIHRRVE